MAERDDERIGAVLVTGGAVLLGISTVLPWGTARIGFGTLSRNAFQLGQNLSVTEHGPVLLVCALLALLAGVARLMGMELPSRLAWSPVLLAAVAGVELGLAAYSIHQWTQTVSAASSLASATIGYGVWIAGLGVIALAIGGGFIIPFWRPAALIPDDADADA